MIGFDRPIRPEWIYNFLNRIEVGEKPSDYYTLFENIVQELTGQEGKRKVRTIVYRSFIYSLQEKKNKISNNYFIELCKKYDYDFVKPILLLKLIADYEINQKILNLLLTHYFGNQYINKKFIISQVVKSYGDKDITKRSASSFITTLLYFKYLIKTKSELSLNKNILLDEQIAEILYCYSIFYLKSKQLNINYLNNDILKIFNINNLPEIAKKFNGTKWDYIKDLGRDLLLIS